MSATLCKHEFRAKPNSVGLRSGMLNIMFSWSATTDNIPKQMRAVRKPTRGGRSGKYARIGDINKPHRYYDMYINEHKCMPQTPLTPQQCCTCKLISSPNVRYVVGVSKLWGTRWYCPQGCGKRLRPFHRLCFDTDLLTCTDILGMPIRRRGVDARLHIDLYV